VLRDAVLVAVAAMLLAGCSLGPKEPKSLPPAPVPPNGSNQSKLGGSIRLQSEASAIRVTVNRVDDPVVVGAADATVMPKAHFAGVFITLRNVGQTNYDESPLSDASLLLSGVAKVLGEGVLGGPCARGFASHAKVLPGAEASGCIAFEVPAGQSPATFQFALDSGFGQEVGMWQLK
jgi:hypothetical protein